jgi:hypothetical protein
MQDSQMEDDYIWQLITCDLLRMKCSYTVVQIVLHDYFSQFNFGVSQHSHAYNMQSSL